MVIGKISWLPEIPDADHGQEKGQDRKNTEHIEGKRWVPRGNIRQSKEQTDLLGESFSMGDLLKLLNEL